jgi:hypothetical protein
VHVELVQEKLFINFLWCEKDCCLPFLQESVKEIKLEDLLFLSAYTDWYATQFLGWGEA